MFFITQISFQVWKTLSLHELRILRFVTNLTLGRWLYRIRIAIVIVSFAKVYAWKFEVQIFYIVLKARDDLVTYGRFTKVSCCPSFVLFWQVNTTKTLKTHWIHEEIQKFYLSKISQMTHKNPKFSENRWRQFARCQVVSYKQPLHLWVGM